MKEQYDNDLQHIKNKYELVLTSVISANHGFAFKKYDTWSHLRFSIARIACWCLFVNIVGDNNKLATKLGSIAAALASLPSVFINVSSLL